MNKAQIKSRLQADPEIKNLLVRADAALSAYRKAVDDLDDILDPGSAARRINQLMGEAKTPDELRVALEAKNEIELQSDDARTAARKLCRESYAPAREAIAAIIARGQSLLTEFAAQAITAEQEFFSTHGLPAEQTSVRAAPQSVLAEFRHFTEILNDKSGRLPVPRPVIMDWFKTD